MITKNEYEVLRLLKKGFRISEAARELGINYTEATKRTRKLRKLGLVRSFGKNIPVQVPTWVDLRSFKSLVQN